MIEMSFFYRYCVVIPEKYKSISELFIKQLKEANFDVQTIQTKEKKNSKLLICISQRDESKMLKEAEYLQIRKLKQLEDKNNKSSSLLPPQNDDELKLPSKLIKCEKMKKIKISEIKKYIPDEVYTILYQENQSKKNDDDSPNERWGLGIFTEGEMLQIETSILEKVTLDLSTQNELQAIYKEINPKTQIQPHLFDESSFFKSLKNLYIITDSFPINISNFNLLIIKKSLINYQCPYELIRSYYGDETAIYFAWIYTFTQYLLIPSFLSLLLFILYKFFPSRYKLFLSFYSLGICLWTQIFSISWERKQKEICIEWNNFDDSYDKVNIREEFIGTFKKSLITGKYEKTYPNKKRIISYIISVISTLCILAISFSINIIFLNLKGVIIDKEDPFYIDILCQFIEDNQHIFKEPIALKIIGYIRGCIMSLMKKINRKLVTYTTNKENHKKKSFYNNSIILKRFLFEFVNSFYFLYYLAFVMEDLSKMQDMIIEDITIGELEKIAKKMILPYLVKIITTRSLFMNFSTTKTKKLFLQGLPINQTNLINQYQNKQFSPFDEYLELIFEFCYLTLFSEIVPMVGPILFILNTIEIRTDIIKLCLTRKRPDFCKKRHIGMWHTIIILIGFVSVFTNLLFTYTFNTSTLNKDKFKSLKKFCVWEHIILGSMFLFRISFPTTKYWVNLFVQRREFRHANMKRNSR